MSKTVIFTIAINDLPYFRYTIPTIEKYAKRIGCDFICIKEPKINYNNIYFEKFYLLELLEKYERVLYLDGDVIISPTAKNIFETCPYENIFYAFNENGEGVMDRDMFIEPLLRYRLNWEEINGKFRYFNAGVLLISSPQKKYLEDYIELSKIKHVLDWNTDQTLFNYLVSINEIPFESLDYSFNRMFMGNSDNDCERLKANFIHYAGEDIFSKGDKLKTIKHDYEKLWGKK